MRNRAVRTLMTLLLSAAMLLGGLMPPAVQHAHADGDQSHSHQTACSAAGQHEHPHSHPHNHAPGHAQSDVVQGQTLHRHVSLFGLDLFMPVRDHQDLPNNGSDAGDDAAVTLVRLVETAVVLASAPAGERQFFSFPSLATVATGSATILRPQRGRDTICSLPLCDSARGERSGVQLI